MAKKQKEELNLKQLAENYADIDAQIAELEDKKKEVKTKIQEGMKDAGADKIETNHGSFTIYPRTSWEYSQSIKDSYEALKQQEKSEQETGVAKPTVTESFRFTPLKVKAK